MSLGALVPKNPEHYTPAVTLRVATPADGEEVATVYLASRKTFLPYAPLAHSDAEVQRWITEQLIPSGDVIVAEQGSSIVGMMATSTSDGASWIDQLYVRPDAVGNGSGAELLKFAKARLARPIRLHSFQANAGAGRFYERHGFVPIHFCDGEDNEEKCPDVLYELSSESRQPD